MNLLLLNCLLPLKSLTLNILCNAIQHLRLQSKCHHAIDASSTLIDHSSRLLQFACRCVHVDS